MVRKGAHTDARGRPRTSTDQADGTEQSCLRVIHLQGQELPSKGKDEVCEGPKASIVHLGAVQGQPIRERHGVLLWGIPCTDSQHLEVVGEVRTTVSAAPEDEFLSEFGSQ